MLSDKLDKAIEWAGEHPAITASIMFAVIFLIAVLV